VRCSKASGGSGNDTFIFNPLLPGQPPTNSSPVIIDGGIGNNTIDVYGFPFEWSWTSKGTVTNLYHDHTLVAQMSNVENIHYTQTGSTVPLDHHFIV
jgi:hypothetical protein